MMRFGSLFTGIACFDEGLRRAGMECRWQVEIDRQASAVCERYFPGVPRYGDVREFARTADPSLAVDVICGGDPCPFRSKARSTHGSSSPDLYPEFLRVVSTLRPLWVLREHVAAGDVDECALRLAQLGYLPVCVEMDGAEITGQSRPRQFLCAVLGSSGICPAAVFHQAVESRGDAHAGDQTMPVARCLTTHPQRFDACDNYILEPGRGTRILAPEERERLMGLEPGWTAGFSDRARARMTGNALIVQEAEWLGRRILESGRLS